jgi:hypothetical protein
MERGVTTGSSGFSLATSKDDIGLYIVVKITASNVIGTYLKWRINTKKLFLRKNETKNLSLQ